MSAGTCSNCEREILRSEDCCVWNQLIVCRDCYESLAGFSRQISQKSRFATTRRVPAVLLVGVGLVALSIPVGIAGLPDLLIKCTSGAVIGFLCLALPLAVASIAGVAMAYAGYSWGAVLALLSALAYGVLCGTLHAVMGVMPTSVCIFGMLLAWSGVICLVQRPAWAYYQRKAKARRR